MTINLRIVNNLDQEILTCLTNRVPIVDMLLKIEHREYFVMNVRREPGHYKITVRRV